MKSNGTLQIRTPSELEVVVTRAFDAPRRLVFDALTRPELLKRWYGPVGWSLVVCEIDLKVGGAFRLVSRRADGKDIGQCGVYLEIAAPERLVNTEWWEDWNPGEVLVTTVLLEQDGKTLLTNTSVYPSQEVRDIILKSGLEKGATELYAKLDEYLASIASP
jgi:uncharacterized protein YndB with AHSA1/START domain